MKTVFIVDDSDANLFAAQKALSNLYSVYTLPSAAAMFKLLDKITPDLLLMDIKMPEMNGFEAIERLKSNERYAHIPVIFLTGQTDVDTEAQGFELGAVDFIPKPFSEPALQNRIKSHLEIEQLVEERVKDIKERMSIIQKTHADTVAVMANMVESKDEMTQGHTDRIACLVKKMVDAMLAKGIYADESASLDAYEISLAAKLHDIGKNAVPEEILNKKGALTPEEYAVIKTHALEGEKILSGITSEADNDPFLRTAAVIAGNHHESWDGSGYPRGLKGKGIPLLGRIAALADVYDALVSVRPYKDAYTHERAIGIITQNKGVRFDPRIVDVFIEVSDCSGGV